MSSHIVYSFSILQQYPVFLIFLAFPKALTHRRCLINVPDLIIDLDHAQLALFDSEAD